MKRRVFAILSALSLLLCMATLVVWVLGIERQYVLRHGGGGIQCGSDRATYVAFTGQRGTGVGWTHSDVWFEGEVRISHWLLFLLAVLLPAIWLVFRRYRSRSVRMGFCCKCGYDLTGNVSGICPECGTAVPDGNVMKVNP